MHSLEQLSQITKKDPPDCWSSNNYGTLIEVYKETSDCWYPNYHGNLVKVIFNKLLTLPNEPEEWKVSVWGNDDFGMAKTFDNRNKAFECFIDVIKLKIIRYDELKETGFIQD